VAAVEPDLAADVVLDVLGSAAGSRQALRWLGTHLDEHPGVLVDGPTSTIPVLDRFTRGLSAAGAHRVRVIHPACAGCGVGNHRTPAMAKAGCARRAGREPVRDPAAGVGTSGALPLALTVTPGADRVSVASGVTSSSPTWS